VTDSIIQRKAELRTRLVDSRSSLHPHWRRRADRRLSAHLLRLLDDRDYVDIAAFISFRGEPDLSEALAAIHEAGRRVWLPAIDGRSMRFRRWRPGVSMTVNRFGIPEPGEGPECTPRRLELVLAPLVAFDGNGTRLGMGAGFYDRTFEFMRAEPHAGPWLVGVAYAMQQVDGLPAESWDVPLAAVLTERGLRVFRE